MWFSANKPVVRRARGVRVRSRPGWLCEENRHAPDATEYSSLLHFIEMVRPRTVALRRGFGLGDVLMAVVTLRAFARHVAQYGVEQVVLITRRDYAEMFAAMDLPGIGFARDRGKGAQYPGIDIAVCANTWLQADHLGPPAADHHRMVLYSHGLGFSGLEAAA